MKRVNQVVLQGNLVRDPNFKTLPNGSHVVNFTVACSSNYKSNSGKLIEEVVYIDCEAWDTAAQIIDSKFKKGDPILVSGRMKSDSWENKDGKKVSKVFIRVEMFVEVKFSKNYDNNQLNNDDNNDEQVLVGDQEIAF